MSSKINNQSSLKPFALAELTGACAQQREYNMHQNKVKKIMMAKRTPTKLLTLGNSSDSKYRRLNVLSQTLSGPSIET